jgi:crotonobetainyl-CoA:carnitine CoA-transferase CaiB-like acyl-CoA transferase
VAERLGVGPADCQAGNPRLIYARMTGWRQDGPLAARAGHDINYISVIGVLHAMGDPEQRRAANGGAQRLSHSDMWQGARAWFTVVARSDWTTSRSVASASRAANTAIMRSAS